MVVKIGKCEKCGADVICEDLSYNQIINGEYPLCRCKCTEKYSCDKPDYWVMKND